MRHRCSSASLKLKELVDCEAKSDHRGCGADPCHQGALMGEPGSVQSKVCAVGLTDNAAHWEAAQLGARGGSGYYPGYKLVPRNDNQANSYVTGGRVNGLGHPCRWTITLAVVWCA